MKPDAVKPATGVKLVACPGCGGDSVYAPSNPFRPFCSERCKNIDLGAWASERFCLAASTPTEDQPDDAAPDSSTSH